MGLALCALIIVGAYVWDALIEAPWAYALTATPRRVGGLGTLAVLRIVLALATIAYRQYDQRVAP